MKAASPVWILEKDKHTPALSQQLLILILNLPVYNRLDLTIILQSEVSCLKKLIISES